jgi:VWFA-related protein
MVRFFAALLIVVPAICLSAVAQDAAALSSDVRVEKKANVKTSVSYGLVVDNSGSFRTLLDKVIAVASDIVEENQDNDEAFLVTFVDTPKIVLRQEFTYKKSELHDAAQNMYVEGGQTAILDALKSAADYLATNAKSEEGRSRALVLVTDGEDRASETKIDDLLKILKGENIRVFVIAMSDTRVVTKVIDRLAKETGGLVVTPKRAPDVAAAAKQIGAAMRTK